MKAPTPEIHARRGPRRAKVSKPAQVPAIRGENLGEDPEEMKGKQCRLWKWVSCMGRDTGGGQHVVFCHRDK